MRRIEWYFDFLSPFPYLQMHEFHRLPDDVAVQPRPVLFSAMLDHWGHKGPAEIPPKRRFMFRHVQWQADRLAIPLRFPPAHPFNPLRPLRLAIALGSGMDVVERIYRFIWRDGKDTDNPDHWRELLDDLDVIDGDVLVGDPKVKAGLRANCDAALAGGVFGVPTIIAGGALFWGFDATAMLVDYLNSPQTFETAEMRRVGDLPAGMQRFSR